MLALAQGLTDVTITVVFTIAAGIIIFGADRFPPTRALLDRIDPSRVHARHPSAGPPVATGLVRRVPRDFEPPPTPASVFDYELHA